ncbi:MAG: hypothetical protein HQK83_11235 [Fibrobacteria bacterium]|nr:hypothetical protein [Fibrobacteria bacterium]
MAHLMKHRKIWYVRYKDQTGKWRKTSCGRKATKTDAEIIAKKYASMELNNLHKISVRLIQSTLYEALGEFRNAAIPIPKTDRGSKESSSFSRE